MIDLGTIWQFELCRGHSESPKDGACVMDAVSWFIYGKLGRAPACVCPEIAEYCRTINDVLPDAERQRLRAFIPRLAGTVDIWQVRDQRSAVGRAILRRHSISFMGRHRYLKLSPEECDALIGGLDAMLRIGKQGEFVDPAAAVAAVERFAVLAAA